MKTSEARERSAIGPGEVTGARTALIRALRLHEGDEDVNHLLRGVEAALAHLGVVIDDGEGEE
ncbi:MAG: hypothetical protein HY815_16050 [Candidatus Riflebacteria bacterium]|nr:hypothetical protein [Candidatus Riflebacteria bacterium]